MTDLAERYQTEIAKTIAAVDAKNGRAEAERQAAEAFEKARRQAILDSAPQKDRDLLAKERRNLDRAKADVTRAEADAGKARDVFVAARVAGQDPSEKAIDAADAKLVRAKRDAAIAADIVDRLEGRIVLSVNAERKRHAEAALVDARTNWNAAAERILGTYDAIAELTMFHEAEKAAARELAASNGEIGFRWNDAHDAKVRTDGLGTDYVKTPELRVELAIDGTIVTRGEGVERLAG